MCLEGEIMSTSSQSAPRHSRLRDYGAFQRDLSLLDTLTTTAIRQPDGFTRSLPTQAVPQHGEAQNDTVRGLNVLSSVKKAIKHRWLGWVIRFGITVALLVHLFQSMSWQDALIAVIHVPLGDVLVGLIVGSSGVVLSAYQWRELLRAHNLHLDLADLINLYIVGITFNHFLPTGFGGDTFKSFYIGREARNGVGATCATIMCRTTGFFAMMLLTFPVLILFRRELPLNITLLFILLCLLVCTVIVGALLFALILPALSKNKWARNRFFVLVANMGIALHRSIVMPRAIFRAMAYGAIFWLVAILNCYVYANALDIHTQLGFYFMAVPLVSIIANLPISFNGFGVREGVFVYVFSFIHVTAATALSLAVLLDLQSFFLAFVGGGIFLTLNCRKIRASFSKDHQ